MSKGENMVESYKQRWNEPQSWLKRHTICALGICGFNQQSDDTHIWGECATCGKVAGVVSRSALRTALSQPNEEGEGK